MSERAPYFRLIVVLCNGKVVTRKSRDRVPFDNHITRLHASPFWVERANEGDGTVATRVSYAQIIGPTGILSRAMFPLRPDRKVAA